jgi:hypothetical protein
VAGKAVRRARSNNAVIRIETKQTISRCFQTIRSSEVH